MMGQRRVLLIDDELDLLFVTAARLKTMGFEVVTAPDGEQGWKAIQAKRPDLVLLDVSMPQMDGWELLKRIRSTPDLERLPVIMLTGKGDMNSILKARENKATDYFVKPFEPEELLEYIQRYI